MCNWLIFLCVLVITGAKPDDSDDCGRNCKGEEYECINGQCYCAEGYMQAYFQNACVKCPGLVGEKCFGTCCGTQDGAALQCWRGICQPCYDSSGNWKCRDTVDQIFLVSTTQVVMGTALVLGVVATLILLFKLCTTANLRAFGSGNSTDSRLSIGSLQLYVQERLRDAPPRYTRSTPASAVTISPVYDNNGFIHDSSTPPPPYTEEKSENNQNTTVHI